MKYTQNLTESEVTNFTKHKTISEITRAMKDHPTYQNIYTETVREKGNYVSYLWIHYTTDLGNYNGILLDKECYFLYSYNISMPIADYRYRIERAFITHLHNYFTMKGSN